MAREIEKLALFLDAAPDRPKEADLAALEAIGADLGDGEMFRAIDAIIDGRGAEIGRELARLNEAGVSAIPLLRQLVRRLMNLAEMRGEVDAGTSEGEVVERHRIFFREKPATTRALQRWRSDQIARAIDRAREAERAMTRSGTAGAVLAEAEAAAIARAAARFR